MPRRACWRGSAGLALLLHSIAVPECCWGWETGSCQFSKKYDGSRISEVRMGANCSHKQAKKKIKELGSQFAGDNSPQRITVDLSYNGLGNNGVRPLCRSLEELSRLEILELDLRGNLLTNLESGHNNFWGRLASALEKLTNLKTLRLSLAANPLGAASALSSETVQTLFARLCQHKSLKELVFNVSQTAVPDVEWECNPERLKSITFSMGSPSSWQQQSSHQLLRWRTQDIESALLNVELQLPRCKLGDAGARDLVVGLARFNNLSSLSLDFREAGMSKLGLEDLSGALLKFRRLQTLSLDLRGNELSKSSEEESVVLKRLVRRRFNGAIVTDHGTHVSAAPVGSSTTVKMTSAIATDPSSGPASSSSAATTLASSSTSAIGTTSRAVDSTNAVTDPGGVDTRTEASATTTLVKTTTTAAGGTGSNPGHDDKKNHKPAETDEGFRPQLALLCCAGLSLSAAYAWWKKGQNPEAFQGYFPDFAVIRPGGTAVVASDSAEASLDNGSTQGGWAELHDQARQPVFTAVPRPDAENQQLGAHLTANRHDDYS